MSTNAGSGTVTQLVIADGDLPGLVATMIASEESVRRESLGGKPAVWSSTSQGHDAVVSQAGTLGMRVVSRKSPATSNAPGQRINGMLLEAGGAALNAACPVVVWPTLPAGPASSEPALVGLIADAVNRATLVSRLVSLDAHEKGLPEVRIELPFVDLTDEQLADLACDLGVRFEDCWWWSVDTSEASELRARWGPLLPVAV